MSKYLLILGLGHLLGDFYFQTEKRAKEKEKNYSGVLKHSAEYFVAGIVVIIPVFCIDMLLAVLYLSLMHLAVDSVKYAVVRRRKNLKPGTVFCIDQLVHIFCIGILAYIMYCWNFEAEETGLVKDILEAFGGDLTAIGKWIFAILLICKPSNVLIQKLLYGYKPKSGNKDVIEVDNKVGRKVGTLERLIMLVFIALNQYAALGLVLTAKSIARYDKIAKDEKFAEYYLLGTLLSTACVVFCKLLLF